MDITILTQRKIFVDFRWTRTCNRRTILWVAMPGM